METLDQILSELAALRKQVDVLEGRTLRHNKEIDRIDGALTTLTKRTNTISHRVSTGQKGWRPA